MRAQVRFLATTSDNDLNAVDSYGNTALHVAVERGHVGVVTALLDIGAMVGPANAQVHISARAGAAQCRCRR
jgi:ankyrin repeat protein